MSRSRTTQPPAAPQSVAVVGAPLLSQAAISRPTIRCHRLRPCCPHAGRRVSAPALLRPPRLTNPVVLTAAPSAKSCLVRSTLTRLCALVSIRFLCTFTRMHFHLVPEVDVLFFEQGGTNRYRRS
ncbi:hypothetical protein GUJ93_ZPchr0014g47085 [Zizania palustris]|uniref:Uncharacterized protein n=1 Tax=Zizania palustris TaxID=103762 RepID=A0A8J5SUH0_ZIZPA|nr:hypothetical protein GUJ93_ZPchr0014g47085 [Zizania palustris]